MKWRKRERELEEEIAAHIEMAIRDRIGRGESPESARASAHREFGNEALIKEATRSVWSGSSFDRVLQDAIINLRMLRRTPRFTIAALLCMAFGIGVTTSIFSTLNGV